MGMELYFVLKDIKLIDEKIKDLNKRKKETPIRLNKDKTNLLELEKKNEAKKINLEIEDKKYNHLKTVVEEEQLKLNKAEEKLSKVANSKEYQFALKEINQLKKTLSNIKEQLATKEAEFIKILEEVNLLTTNINEKAKLFEDAMVRVKDELNNIELDLKDLTERKQKIINSMPLELGSMYKKIYDNKGGVAIANMVEDRCSVCNLTLPRQLCNEILKAEKVHHCPSCQRLLICVNSE